MKDDPAFESEAGGTAVAPAPASAETRPARPRALIIDDHPITRQGLRALLSQQLRMEICGEADNAADALDLAAHTPVDVVLLDVSLKAANGLELVAAIRAQAPGAKVLVVSMHDEAIYAERALRAGAMGYVMKQEAGDKIAVAIEHLLRGEIYLSPRLREKYSRHAAGIRGLPALGSLDTLSQREMEVYRLIGDGFSTRDIAARLNLSCKTIESYREHLKVKLALATGAELVRHAIEWGRYQARIAAARNAGAKPAA